MDEVIATPVNLPTPPDTKTYPGDYFPPFPGFPDDPPIVRFRRHIQTDAQTVASLGTLYALTGEEKYGEYAKQLILAYAHASHYTAHPTLNYRNCAGMISQLLEEALIMNFFSFGYDLVYNLPSWKPGERTQVHDELLRPYVMQFRHPAVPVY